MHHSSKGRATILSPSLPTPVSLDPNLTQAARLKSAVTHRFPMSLRSRLRLQQPWTLRSLLCRSRCSRSWQRSTSESLKRRQCVSPRACLRRNLLKKSSLPASPLKGLKQTTSTQAAELPRNARKALKSPLKTMDSSTPTALAKAELQPLISTSVGYNLSLLHLGPRSRSQRSSPYQTTLLTCLTF